MKKLTKILYFSVTVFALAAMLAGCAGKKNEGHTNKTDENASTSGIEGSNTDNGNENSSSEPANSGRDRTQSENVDSNSGNSEDKGALSQYSSEEIEYARVWLQLGANQDIDGLYVQHIPAGTPLNSDDDTSASYPEEVIQLAGSRLVDGSVTYSGNGDGTINVYNVPLRWDGSYPAGEKFYEDLINNTKLVNVDPGNDKEIIELINLLNVHD